MKKMRKLLAACCLLAPFPALAQPDQQMPMMNDGMMGARMMGSGPSSNGMMVPGMMMDQGDLKAMVEGRYSLLDHRQG